MSELRPDRVENKQTENTHSLSSTLRFVSKLRRNRGMICSVDLMRGGVRGEVAGGLGQVNSCISVVWPGCVGLQYPARINLTRTPRS